MEHILSNPVALLLSVHLAVTWAMIGLIWMVQVVHYPLMASVGMESSSTYQTQHVAKIGWLVGPMMVAEMCLALAVCSVAQSLSFPWLAWIGFGTLGCIWLVTVVCSVPAHEVLRNGFHPVEHDGLVRTNWWRTIGWSVRGLIALVLLAGGHGAI
ncbi:MAG: hypothetical protein CL930_15380 [Deltaproteobacteria bacterium]|nr:hypothetical protein [Deltaproteobacteria bacterium]